MLHIVNTVYNAKLSMYNNTRDRSDKEREAEANWHCTRMVAV